MDATKITLRMLLPFAALALAACATQQTTGGSSPAPGGGTDSETAAPDAAAGAVPAPPYYSVQLASFKTEAKAREVFAMAGGEPFTRAEQRGEWLGVRIGAWDSRAEAGQALERHKAEFSDAFVIRCETQPSFIQPESST